MTDAPDAGWPPPAGDGEVTPARRRWWRHRRERVSRWDRPPPRKDWRYFVGLVGRILIVLGLLLFGFVAYQLWGTGIETARAQRRLENEFEELIASASTVPTTTAAPATVPVTVPPETVPGTTVAPATTAAPATTTEPPAVDQAIPPIEIGDPIGHINIPGIGAEWYYVAGVGVDELKKGPGHYPDTPMPGQLGNAAIAGHRTTYGAPFNDVDDLDPGDEIIVTTLLGGRYVYRVTGTEIVSPSDYSVIATTDPDVAQLTLTSCHPEWSTKQRIIIRSVLDEKASDPVGYPVFYADRSDEDVVIPGEDAVDPSTVTTEASAEPVSTAPSTSENTAGPTADGTAATTAEEAGSDDTASDDTEAAATGDEPGPGNERPVLTAASEDAFGRGWFHDSGAWSQVALWGLAVSAVAVGAYLLARRFRSWLLGIAVGLVPFVVALFFFYQNVNRLLPPEL